MASGGLDAGEAVSAMGSEPGPPQAPTRSRAPRIGYKRIVDVLRVREGSPECNRLGKKERPSLAGRPPLHGAMRLRLEEQHHAEGALVRLRVLDAIAVTVDVPVFRHPAKRLGPLVGELADDRPALEDFLGAGVRRLVGVGAFEVVLTPAAADHDLAVRRAVHGLPDEPERVAALAGHVHAVAVAAAVAQEGVTHEERAHALGEEARAGEREAGDVDGNARAAARGGEAGGGSRRAAL